MTYLTIEAAAIEWAKEAVSVDDLAEELERAAGQNLDAKAKAKIRAKAERMALGSDEEKPALFEQCKADLLNAILCGDLRTYNPRTHAPGPNDVKGHEHFYLIKKAELEAWRATWEQAEEAEETEEPASEDVIFLAASIEAQMRLAHPEDTKEKTYNRVAVELKKREPPLKNERGRLLRAIPTATLANTLKRWWLNPKEQGRRKAK